MLYRRRWYGDRDYAWLRLASFIVIVAMVAVGLTMLTGWLWP